MGGLFSNLFVGMSSLRAQQLAMNVVSNNVANVNTPGYSRQRAVFQPDIAVAIPQGLLGTGVTISKVESLRDRFTERQINQQNQGQGELSTLSETLRQIEGIFSETSGPGVQAAISKFFNSFSDLANRPTSLPMRQQVLNAANDLATMVREEYRRLEQLQRQTDQDVKVTVDKINLLTGQIAQLNTQIGSIQSLGKDPSSLRDQRESLLNELAKLVNINHFETENGSVSILTGNGKPLVIADKSYALQASQVAPSPFFSILHGSSNITGDITSGKLGALLKIRDGYIPKYLQDLDTLASTVISAVNTQHRAGADLNGVPGGDFFVPASGPGAARNISVAITDPARIAAARAGGAAGDNSNALALAGLQRSRLISGSTVNEFYALLVSKVGMDSRGATDGLETQKSILRQLKNQRDSISGVSLDEEAVNLIQFQKAFEAASRLIGVVNSLTEETMRILGR